MHQVPLQAVEPSDGFLLFDSSMNPIFINPVGAQLINYPYKLENSGHFLLTKIRSSLLLKQSSGPPVLVSEFQSGRRSYLCRALRVESMAGKGPQFYLAVILERSVGRSIPPADLLDRFHLTPREKEVFQRLMQGLTSKEIAIRMGVSPNTVKAFLRLIMVKMGVSTRSGIIGKAYNKDDSRRPNSLPDRSYSDKLQPERRTQLE